MKTKYIITITIVAIIVVIASVIAGGYLSTGILQQNTNPVTLNAAGATFPQPLLTAMITKYTSTVNSKVEINYDGVGSGQGIADLESKTVDFAASDAPLSSSDAEKAPDTLHIPETIGAVTIAYNLPGVPTGLHLTGKVISDIFQGKITTWNDPAIQSINTNITLPAKPIQVVHRSDSSGTTFIFTGYLSASSNDWKNAVGQGKTVAWPLGIGAQGNPGVASVVQGTQFMIGYVELAYALQNSMTVAAVQNPTGNWITPSLSSIQDAVQSVASSGLPAGDQSWANVNLLNANEPQAYPIVSFTYLLVYKELNVVPGETQAKATAAVQFLWWVVHDGQGIAPNLEYVTLPQNVVQIDEKTIQSITFNGQHLPTS
ncbi:MAG: phosphate ABC transporter substrate-binding protein PstS [Candidatus Bathyarchaeia archaeon]